MTKKTLAATAALIALAVPASASAKIVPQRGIAGANLDMSRAQLTESAGDPDGKKSRTSPIFGKYETWLYGKTSVDLFRKSGKVFNVSTTSRAQKTATGVGVGSTATAVKKGVKGVKCDKNHCFVGHFDPGRKVTDFNLSTKTGRVTRVTIGYVID